MCIRGEHHQTGKTLCRVQLFERRGHYRHHQRQCPASREIGQCHCIQRNRKPIIPRSENQLKLVEAFAKNDMLFAIGPAGSGKTYTAIALAVRALKNKEIKKIILSRPAVEAGEKLGFLPGDMKDKIDPYLQPLYDALQDMIPAAKLKEYMELNIIQIAPSPLCADAH